LALQLALSHPLEVRACQAAYPMIDMRAPHYTEDYEKKMQDHPTYPSSVTTEHLEALPDGPCPSAVNPPKRQSLAFGMCQHGHFKDSFGDDRKLYPLDRLEDGGLDITRKLPSIWLFHGVKDSVIPVDGSRKFMQTLRRFNPQARVRYTEIEGADHGVTAEIGLVKMDGSKEFERGMKFVNTALFWGMERGGGKL
jgi:hypothetical protein